MNQHCHVTIIGKQMRGTGRESVEEYDEKKVCERNVVIPYLVLQYYMIIEFCNYISLTKILQYFLSDQCPKGGAIISCVNTSALLFERHILECRFHVLFIRISLLFFIYYMTNPCLKSITVREIF